MVPIGLLEARVIGGGQRQVAVEEWQPVRHVMHFPVRHNIREREGRGPTVKFFVGFLLLSDFLESKEGAGESTVQGKHPRGHVAEADNGVHPHGSLSYSCMKMGGSRKANSTCQLIQNISWKANVYQMGM